MLSKLHHAKAETGAECFIHIGVFIYLMKWSKTEGWRSKQKLIYLYSRRERNERRRGKGC